MNEEIDYVKLEHQLLNLPDFVRQNHKTFSNNVLGFPLIPTDIQHSVENVFSEKYNVQQPYPVEIRNLGVYEKYIASIKEENHSDLSAYNFKYIDKKNLKGVTPEYVLRTFKKSLIGNEKDFDQVLLYAEKSLHDRLLYAKAETFFEVPESSLKEIYSSSIEYHIKERAKNLKHLIEAQKEIVVKSEHSDINVQPGEWVDRKFKSTEVTAYGEASELLRKAGESFIERIRNNELEGLSFYEDPIFTLDCKNPKTNYKYSFENTVLLNDEVSKHGFKSALFLTFNQMKAMGFEIPKGTKSSKIVERFGMKGKALTKRLDDGSEVPVLNDEGIPQHLWKRAVKTVAVFNIDLLHWPHDDKPDPRIKWLDDYNRPFKIEASNHDAISTIKDAFDKSVHIPVHVGGVLNFYSPAKNEITVSGSEMFVNELEELHVKFHEWAHSTGHELLQNRETLHYYNVSDSYRGREELVAEMAAMKTAKHFNLDVSELGVQYEKNRDAYGLSWALPVAKENPDFIIQSMIQADRASRFMIERIENTLRLENKLDQFIKPENQIMQVSKLDLSTDVEGNADVKIKQINKFRREIS